jgi:hypothetical protein
MSPRTHFAGRLGSGKTVSLQGIVITALLRGSQVVDVDPKAEQQRHQSRSTWIALATAATLLVGALLIAHPATAAAATGGTDPFKGGSANLKQLWQDWIPWIFAIAVGAMALKHYGRAEHGKLLVAIVAGALVGWVIGDPLGHLTALGNQVSSFFSG